MYICIKCLMYVILLGELKLVGTIFAFAIETKLKKNHQKWFFLSSRFSNFLLPSSPLLFIFGHCWFYTISWLMISSKVYGIIMSLNWIFFKKNTDSLIYGEVKFWSWYLVMDKFGCPKVTFGPLHWQGDSFASSMLITSLYLICSKGHWEPWNEVGFQTVANHIFSVWT